MYVFLVTGRTRQGKSRFVKSMIVDGKSINRPCIVYDFQGEYGDCYNTIIKGQRAQVKGVGLPLYKPGVKRSRFVGKPEDFIALVTAKDDAGNRLFKGYNIVFDEATIYLKGNVPEHIRDLIISRFHDNNNLIFVFHKMQTIPPDLMDFSNILVLFKTFDTPKNVWSRFEEPLILEAFKRQYLKPDGAPPIIVNRTENTLDKKPFNA